MNWPRLLTSPRRVTGAPFPWRVRYRPHLDKLEDRTLPTITTFGSISGTLSLEGSYFTYSGTNYPITDQDPLTKTSLTTTYTSGQIVTDLDLTGNTINFLDASAGSGINADISGNWQPGVGGVHGQMDPANYGGTFVFLGVNYAAIRNLVSEATTSAPLPLTPAGGGLYTYPSTQTVAVVSGNLDYDTGLFGNGTTSIAGLNGPNNAADGSLQDNGDGTFTLTVNVNANIFYDLGGGASTTIKVTGSVSGVGTPGMGPASFGQVFGAHPVQSSPLTNGVGTSQGLDAMPLPSTASAAATSATAPQVSDSQLAPAAHPNSTAALDAVFVDPVTSGVLPF